jgi:ketosteroid isomerase-like protein
MKSLLFIVAAVGSQPASTDDPRATAITEVINQIWSGWETNDRAAVERNLASQFVDTDFTGVRRGKQEVLAFLAPSPGPRTPISITRSAYQFQFHGTDTAVVSYRAQDCRGEQNGRPRCFRFAATDTFVLEEGRWRLAAGLQLMLPADSGDEAEVSRREVIASADAIDRAQLRNEPDVLARLLADDWTLVHARGLVVSKEKFLADVRTDWRPTNVSYGERNVALSTDGAVVSGLITWEWTGKDGEQMRATERFSDMYNRDYGRWRRTRSHVSCVAGACG